MHVPRQARDSLALLGRSGIGGSNPFLQLGKLTLSRLTNPAQRFRYAGQARFARQCNYIRHSLLGKCV